MVEILRQLIKFKISRNALHGPRFRNRLKSPKEHFARILFIIRTFIGHAQHRHLAQPLNRLTDDIKMLAGLERNINAQHPPNLMAPHATTIDHILACDGAAFALLILPLHRCDPATRACYTHGFGLLKHLRTHLTRALGQSQRDIGRIALAIQRQPNSTGHPINIEMLVFCFNLRGGDFFDIHPKGPCHSRLTINFLPALFGQSHSNRTAAFEPSGNAGFRFQIAIKFLAVFRQFRHIGRRPKLRNQARCVPCGA